MSRRGGQRRAYGSQWGTKCVRDVSTWGSLVQSFFLPRSSVPKPPPPRRPKRKRRYLPLKKKRMPCNWHLTVHQQSWRQAENLWDAKRQDVRDGCNENGLSRKSLGDPFGTMCVKGVPNQTCDAPSSSGHPRNALGTMVGLTIVETWDATSSSGHARNASGTVLGRTSV